MYFFFNSSLFKADANIQIINYQEELSRKTADNIRQQDEITNLLSHILRLQKSLKELTIENDTHLNDLQLSHDCQNELTKELIDLKEKHSTLLNAFHEFQTEFKRRNHRILNHYPPHGIFMPVSESLAFEIESTLGSEGYESEVSDSRKKLWGDTRCQSPDSLLSGEFRQTPLPAGHSNNKSFLFNKLQMVKALEGSEILRNWQRLATPHLGVILEPGVPNKAIKNVNDCPEEENMNDNNISKNIATSSIYTFTTSHSRARDSTFVTPSFATFQISTGMKSSYSIQESFLRVRIFLRKYIFYRQFFIF